MVLSAPAFAQSTKSGPVTSSPGVTQPSGAPVVNYQNGLQALGQVDPNQNSDNTGTWIAAGVIFGGAIAAGLLIANNEGKSVSP